MVGSAARELLLVIAVAVVGVLLASAVAFAPWPVNPGRPAPSGLVDLHGPAPTGRLGSASG
ncbi:hypothetical protein SAMN05443287_103273 [Micromonospora phaseoli]|uniref:Uncharacterized protein n=1 Tax=Micromonospora phaseoli TaxID=1144548 RepID=A0A1H6WQ26_9ACTN|nr:hypothetical protein [Micromonospora phaseoli]PZW01903.1 hypothetical protein CLV64_102272 [Micromonospora phaseoli]GIJ80651.1 hypothetical protein Xph01_50830 [Micromonospora phaseoli]SEJ18973.1 hypothetical protein SAMN05443287_103273 [Micromonospora phaseoli]